MKAWLTETYDGEHQLLVFAEKRSEAIQKSEAIETCEYIEVRATRAKYADGLEGDTRAIKLAQLKNGWWFECYECSNTITEDDVQDVNKNVTESGVVLCDKCLSVKA